MSAVVRRPPPRVTLAEFLTWPGDGTAKRYQLVDGEVRAMSPASVTHGAIQTRVGTVISNHLDRTNSSCWVSSEAAVVPRVGADTNLRVPDLAVTCTEGEAGQVVLPEPVLLIGILSPRNESDTRENVWAYTTIPSVREILVLHSTRIAAETLLRGRDGVWPGTPVMLEGGDAALRLDSIGLACPLADLYVRSPLMPR